MTATSNNPKDRILSETETLLYKKETHEIWLYTYSPNDLRKKITATADMIYILCSTDNGSGFQVIPCLRGQSWWEGAEEFLGVFDTEEEAWAYPDE